VKPRQNSTTKWSTVASRSKAWSFFTLLNAGVVGSNPTRGYLWCVYSVCVVLCVGGGLAMGWSPICAALRNWKAYKANKGLYNYFRTINKQEVTISYFSHSYRFYFNRNLDNKEIGNEKGSLKTKLDIKQVHMADKAFSADSYSISVHSELFDGSGNFITCLFFLWIPCCYLGHVIWKQVSLTLYDCSMRWWNVYIRLGIQFPSIALVSNYTKPDSVLQYEYIRFIHTTQIECMHSMKPSVKVKLSP
jgi:hypothetical protein